MQANLLLRFSPERLQATMADCHDACKNAPVTSAGYVCSVVANMIAATTGKAQTRLIEAAQDNGFGVEFYANSFRVTFRG